jgi:hypothetical protein
LMEPVLHCISWHMGITGRYSLIQAPFKNKRSHPPGYTLQLHAHMSRMMITGGYSPIHPLGYTPQPLVTLLNPWLHYCAHMPPCMMITGRYSPGLPFQTAGWRVDACRGAVQWAARGWDRHRMGVPPSSGAT